MQKLTNQELFDAVVSGLRKQGCKSLTNLNAIVWGGERPNDTLACAYRGDNGTKCAVGQVIPDEVYNTRIENKSVSWITTIWDDSYKLPWNKKSVPLLSELQGVHDMADTKNWEHNWKQLAVEFDLIYTPPEQAQMETN